MDMLSVSYMATKNEIKYFPILFVKQVVTLFKQAGQEGEGAG
jgi:hypothetical protein